MEHGNSAMTMMPVAPEQARAENLQPLGIAGMSTQLWLARTGQKAGEGANQRFALRPGLGASA
jgi:hypothetical protein